jgi:integrase
MRASEVLSLDREHVNLGQGVAILPDTKNGDRRIVPLPPEVVETLQRRPMPLREIFPGWTLGRLEKAFTRAVRGAGLQSVSFHTSRHTFASYAVMAGVDLYTLAKILGHRDVKIVQRYAHLAPAHLQADTNQTASAIFAADMPQKLPHTIESAA